MDAARGPVVVDGWGRLADEVSAQLRRCRVEVRAGAHAADAAELALAAGSPAPSAVVLVSDGHRPGWVDAPSLAAPWESAGVPVLPLAGGDGSVVVGPLVVPGRSPCLGCAAGAVPRPGPRAADPPTVVLAAAVAVVVTFAVGRGDLSLAGVSTEVGPRGTSVLHRVWTSRPGCRCSSVRMAG
ncbi:hypothetical protein [Phycicoccus sonneratiae]|uniref:Bacteriocin biosynthesis cyclodehydratase domain-containing protein n=1 Tax=Phycicoccus sonneratiae TaxID=2807628 RepID=A0ABS2CNI4_9MICO|nr:hypothetical protein [Phycicoccus sonneraticus]MBM6400721.1 hypothetical protein [Phycicoccus sonneraticus]